MTSLAGFVSISAASPLDDEGQTTSSLSVQTGGSSGGGAVFTNGTAGNVATSTVEALTADNTSTRRDIAGGSQVGGDASSVGRGFFRHNVGSTTGGSSHSWMWVSSNGGETVKENETENDLLTYNTSFCVFIEGISLHNQSWVLCGMLGRRMS